MSKTARDFIKAISDSEKRKTSAYDSTATVTRVDDDGTAWVHIPGGVSETPAKMTVNASVGDSVQVRVSGGKAFLTGNATNPPTDDTTATKAYYVATDAADMASSANAAATQAWAYADTAKDAADAAQESADAAQASADDALASSRRANSYATDALYQLSVIEDVAGVLQWIEEHGSYTATSDTTPQDGTVYFEYDATSGDYTPVISYYEETSDTSYDATKTYYTFDDATGVYTAFTGTAFEDGVTYYELLNPSTEGWYVLDISDSQSDFIMAHLAVTARGLWVLPSGTTYVENATGDGSTTAFTLNFTPTSIASITVDGDETEDYTLSGDTVTFTTAPDNGDAIVFTYYPSSPQYASDYKVLLASDGMYVYNADGDALAVYGSTITIGDTSADAVYIDTDEVSIYSNGTPMISIDGSTPSVTVGDETSNRYSVIENGSYKILSSGGIETYEIGLSETTAVRKTNIYTSRGGVTSAGTILYRYLDGATLTGGNITVIVGSGTNYTITISAVDTSYTVNMYRAIFDSSGYLTVETTASGSWYISSISYYTEFYTPILDFGYDSSVIGSYSSSFGEKNAVSGTHAIASGYTAYASGDYSQSEGIGVQALGSASHAQNAYTIATHDYQTVIGKYNEIDPYLIHESIGTTTTLGTVDNCSLTLSNTPTSIAYVLMNGLKASSYELSGTTITGYTSVPAALLIMDVYYYTSNSTEDYALIIGNGTSDSARSNALTVDWNGFVETESIDNGGGLCDEALLSSTTITLWNSIL